MYKQDWCEIQITGIIKASQEIVNIFGFFMFIGVHNKDERYNHEQNYPREENIIEIYFIVLKTRKQ